MRQPKQVSAHEGQQGDGKQGRTLQALFPELAASTRSYLVKGVLSSDELCEVSSCHTNLQDASGSRWQHSPALILFSHVHTEHIPWRACC